MCWLVSCEGRAVATPLDCSGIVVNALPGEEGVIPTSLGFFFSDSIEDSGSAIVGCSLAGSTGWNCGFQGSYS